MNAHAAIAWDDDTLADTYPAFRPLHLLTVTAPYDLDILKRLLSNVEGLGARLERLSSSRFANSFQHRFCLSAIRPAQARWLASQFAGIPGVISHVEHHIERAADDHR